MPEPIARRSFHRPPSTPAGAALDAEPALLLLEAIARVARLDAAQGSYEAKRFLAHLAESVRPAPHATPAAPPQRHADAPGPRC